MHMSIIIRDERASDVDAIAALTAAAFVGKPYSDGSEAAIVARLRRAGALTLSLIAVDAGTIVGHAAFSPAGLDGAVGAWYGLGPISVIPDRQRSGIGSALLRQGLERLRRIGAAGVVLVGDPAFYGRLGFATSPGLSCEGVPDENAMALVFDGSQPAGKMRFHPAFFGDI
jgi:putative acetyltransferase